MLEDIALIYGVVLSGRTPIRVGTPAITTRGLVESDMETIVELIDEVLNNHEDDAKLEAISEKVNVMMSDRPLFS